jgi:hypothetical protein
MKALARAKGSTRCPRGADDDAVASIQRLDDPSLPGIDADVARPPEDVAGADVADVDLRESVPDCICGSR